MGDRAALRQARARAAWAPPGPVPPGDRGAPDLLPRDDETLDAFAGHWRLFQLRGGHRYSTDDLLAAWYAVTTMEELGAVPTTALDLGTGIGSVGLLLAWCWPELSLTGVEAQPRSLELARRSARYNGVAARATYHLGDLRDGVGHLGRHALVTASPPYWDPAAGTLSDGPQKAPCRFELRGGLEVYLAAAREVVAPGGRLVLVFDGRQQERLERAAGETGWAIARRREVIPREGKAVLLVLVALTGAGGAALPEPPLILRHADGARTDEFRTLRARMGFPPGP